jgi:HEAT repeat protein
MEILKRIVGQSGASTLPLWNASEASSPFAVPTAVPWLLRARGADFAELGSLLAGLMRKTRPLEWTRLYAEFRSPWITPDEVVRLRRLRPEDAVELLGVATLGANGYTREAALRELSVLAHPRAVPYTLLRLGDWVPQVRSAAIGTLRSLMPLGIAEQLLEYHYLIARLRHVERLNQSTVVDEIAEYLQKTASRPAVEQALLSKREPHRLFAYQLLGKQWDERLVAQALADPAPSIRLWLTRTFLASAPPEALALLPRLLRDKSSRVSTTIINALTPAQIVASQHILLDLAFSDARQVREASRYILQHTSQADLVVEARRRLAESESASISPGAIAGLGEVGEEADCAALLPLLGSRRSRVREAAVKALGRLGGEPVIGQFFGLLNDPNGNVRRAVTWVLMRSAWQSWVPAVRRVLLHGSEGGQTQALQILAHQSGWNSVPDLLRALLSDHSRLREHAWHNIYNWQRIYGIRGWIPPSPETLNDVAKLWPHVVQARPEAPKWVATSWNEFQRLLTAELRTQGRLG